MKNKDIKSIEYLNKNSYFIKWYMNTWCNYHCPYCIQGDKSTNKESQEEQEIRAGKLNQILLNNKIDKPLNIRLLGGECTIYDLTKILDKFSLPISLFSLTTNFSRDLNYFKKLYLYCKQKHIQFNLTCSWHEENLEFFSKLEQLLIWIKQNNFSKPKVNVVVTNDTNLDYFEEQEKKLNLQFKYNIVRGKGNSQQELNPDLVKRINAKVKTYSGGHNLKVTFTNNEEKYFDSGFQIINQLDCGGFIGDGRLCDAGVNSINIRAYGDIYRGACSFLNNSEHLIGYLDDSNLKLPTEPILCEGSKFRNYSVRCSLCNHTSVGPVIKENLFKEEIDKYE